MIQHMKRNLRHPGFIQPFHTLLLLVSICCFVTAKSYSQAAFTTAWPLTADQSFNSTGAGASTVTGANQLMSSTLFIPVANAYIGTTSGTAGDGQRCSPRLNDLLDGGWVNDGGAVEGRYEQFEVAPNTGYNMNVTNISFTVGNRSRSELKGNVYYYVAASSAAFTMGTGTLLGSSQGASSTNNWNTYSYTTNINVTSGNKIFVRIYPYNTGSATGGKYFCTRNVSISGTTTTPNFTNITFTTPATCTPGQLTLTWTGPAGFNSGTQTILAFLKAGAFGAISPNNIDISTGYNSQNAVFSGPASTYQNDATAKLIYRGTGTDAFGNHNGLVITGLTGGTTYHVLLFAVTGTTSYSTGINGSGTTQTTIGSNPTSMNAPVRPFAQSTTTLPVSWTAVTTGTVPNGYAIKISNAGVHPNFVNFTDTIIQTDVSGGVGAVKVAGNLTTSYNGFTGLQPGTMYNFRTNTYLGVGGCIRYGTTNRLINVATQPEAVSNPSFAIDAVTGVGTINWTAPATYNNTNHTTLVFVKNVAAVNTDPWYVNQIRNPATYYTANPIFGSGTAYTFDVGAFCVYKGNATSCNVTGLTQGNTYHVLVLTMMLLPNTNIGTGSPQFIQSPGGVTYSTSAYATTSTVYGGTYTWNAGNTAGNFAAATSWTPNRNTPTSSDQLIFNTGENITPSGFTTQPIGTLTVTGNTTLNMTASGQTLTVNSNNGAASDLIINSGSRLNLSNGQAVTLNTGTTADVSGTLNVDVFGIYNTTNAGAINTVTGTFRSAGTLNTIANNIVVNNNGTFDHAFNGGTLPTCVWNTGSTCRLSGITSAGNMTGHSQVFSRFVYDCAGQGTQNFVLGVNTSLFEALESFTVNRTGTGSLQLTSSSGQRDYTVGNYYQFGGNVSITQATGAGGQRSLTVNNNFYASDSLGNTSFYILNDAVNAGAYGRLFVAGNMVMRQILSNNVILEKVGPLDNFGEVWFNGNADQYAQFHTIAGNIDFNIAQTVPGFGVTLESNATAYKLYLTQGDFNIAANTLTVNHTVTYPSPGTGTIGGSSASNLTLGFAGTTGTLNFANTKRILKDFTQLASNTTTLGTELAITAGPNPGRDSIGASATLITNDNLILRSDADGTARIAQLPSTAAITGKVTVERYLPMNLSYDSRRWRLLTAPFKATNSPTINAAWQESVSNSNRLAPVNPRPGYGTQITKSTTWAADGYDQGSTNNPSIYYYSAGNWVAPANTNTVKITDNSNCYMLFARGDRSTVITNQFVAASPTTLAPKGELNIGNVTIPLAASGYQTVGNPYASAIRLNNVQFNDTLGISKTFYIWDPKTLGSANVGRFITCSGNGTSFTYTGNTSLYQNNPGVIESSGAFMVPGNGNNIVFHESDKFINSSTIGIASRPVRNPGPHGNVMSLHIDMTAFKNGVPSLADGIALEFNKNFANDIDGLDASKLTTFYTREELSICNGGNLFAIERRNDIIAEDTVFLQISKLNTAAYQFHLRPAAFGQYYTATLEDRYKNTSTPIDLLNGSTVDFSITTDSASFAGNRFYIIFKNTTPAPVVVTKPGFTIFPNPIQNGLVNLQMNGMEAGLYQFTLVNNMGQTLQSGRITYAGGNTVEQIELKNGLSKGMYEMLLLAPGAKKSTALPIMIQ